LSVLLGELRDRLQTELLSDQDSLGGSHGRSYGPSDYLEFGNLVAGVQEALAQHRGVKPTWLESKNLASSLLFSVK